MKKSILGIAALLAFSSLSQAAIIQLDLMGKGGAGLLATNEWSAGVQSAIAGTPGSGGELGLGFTFDDVAKVLTLSFSWTGIQGTVGNPFGVATGFHIHGPVTNPDVMGFTAASVLHNISAGTAGGGATPSYTVVNNVNGSGQVTGTISNIPTGQETDLLAGRWYVNVHSGRNGSGEIRGNIIVAPVPEPSTFCVAGLSLLGLVSRRRR